MPAQRDQSTCFVSSRERRPGEKCGTVGCHLIAHLSARRQAAAYRWRCFDCGRFTPSSSGDRCADCEDQLRRWAEDALAAEARYAVA